MPQSVFLKDTTEWREWLLNRDRVGHEPGALTTRPRCRQLRVEQQQEEKHRSGMIQHITMKKNTLREKKRKEKVSDIISFLREKYNNIV